MMLRTHIYNTYFSSQHLQRVEVLLLTWRRGAGTAAWPPGVEERYNCLAAGRGELLGARDAVLLLSRSEIVQQANVEKINWSTRAADQTLAGLLEREQGRGPAGGNESAGRRSTRGGRSVGHGAAGGSRSSGRAAAGGNDSAGRGRADPREARGTEQRRWPESGVRTYDGLLPPSGAFLPPGGGFLPPGGVLRQRLRRDAGHEAAWGMLPPSGRSVAACSHPSRRVACSLLARAGGPEAWAAGGGACCGGFGRAGRVGQGCQPRRL
jgi:hypothetical protein